MSGILQTLIGSLSGVIKDAYFNLVTFLLNTTSTNGAQNNTFIDSSSNTFAITRNPASGPNAPAQGSFTPFSQTGWSGAFNTTTTYLTVTDTANLRFGAGNFTIEAWVYRNSTGTVQSIASKGTSTTGWLFSINASNQLSFTDTSTAINGATSLAANTWYYVAVVRAGTGASQTTLYVNGASDGTGQSATTFNQTNNMLVGANRSTANFADGYISNLRLSNTNRTISSTPTTPLTADANTIFLALNINNFYYTDSTAAFVAMVPTGTPSVQAFSPFAPTTAYSTPITGGSGYFDGTGDYLTTPYNAGLSLDTGDFCVEAYVYKTAASGNDWKLLSGTATAPGMFIGDGGTTSSRGLGWGSASAGWTFISGVYTPVNEWAHICYTRLSGVGRIFLNGYMRAYTASNTTNLSLSSSTLFICSDYTNTYALQGYMSNLRIIKGSVPTGYQTSATTPSATTQIFVPPTAPVTTTSQGASSPALILNCVNSGIYDATAKNDAETVGNAQVSTTQTKFGTTSMAYDGTGDYLLIPDSPNLQLGTGDFTIEGFVYLTATGVAYGIISKGAAATGWSVNVTSGNKLQFSYTATALTGATSLSSGTWYYFAVTRSGSATGNLKLYLGTTGSTTLDATSAGAVTDNFNQTNSMYVGASRTGTTNLNGYLDEVRVTKGFARTVTTVPTAAFPVQ